MTYIKIMGDVRFADILDVLEIESIPDCDHRDDREFRFDHVEVDSDDMIMALKDLGLMPEPDVPEFKKRDLIDAFDHLRKGETSLARIMFDRVFSDLNCNDASPIIEQAMRDWPWVPDHG